MKRIVRNPDILWREEDDAMAEAARLLEEGGDAAAIGTAILFADGTMTPLNLLGTRIWKYCEGRTAEEVVIALLDEFEVEPDILRNDVAAFLAELADKGYISYG